jgi:GTPase
LIDRPQAGERTLLVHIYFSTYRMQEDLDEFQELARSAGAQIIGLITGTRHTPEPRYFVGSGKAEEIRAAVVDNQAQLVIFDHTLTPAQERNLEKLFNCRVVDRTGLILDIFAQRARSFEGKLQVELAFLRHMSTRLVRGWTHLERQRGGIGLRGGPGETQLETDRRLIRRRIDFILKRLQKVRQQREQSRRARRRATVPTLALVGYTNAGKSTLFNALSGSSVYVADQLFATLDPTLRRIELKELGAVIIADTVGFIRHLPHDLIEAFKATLEEVSEADLLLHVVDFYDERRQENIEEVNEVLKTMDAGWVPQLRVYNKIDLCAGTLPAIEHDHEGKVLRVKVSAKIGLGIDELMQAIIETLGKDLIQCTVRLTPEDARLRAEFYKLKAVLSEEIDEMGYYNLFIRMPKAEYKKLMSR